MAKQVEQTKLPNFYFSFHVLLFKYTGVEVLESKESFLYRIYSLVLFLFVSWYVLLECIELKFQTDFDIIGAIWVYIINHGAGMGKVVLLYINRKEIGALVKSFHEGFYKPDKQRGGVFEEQCIYKVLQRTKFQTDRYATFFVLSIVSGIVQSLKSRFASAPGDWALPYLPISFVDTTHSPGFEIYMIYQVLAASLNCTWTFLCDCSVIFLLSQTSAQLKILDHSIRNYKNRDVDASIAKEEKEKSLRIKLHNAFKHHQDILQNIQKIEYYCCYIVFCVFLSNLILLCLVMYCTSIAPAQSIEFVRYMVYTGVVGVQLLLYCWWGNEVTLASDALVEGIFEAYDPDDSIHTTKSLELMLLMAQRPIFFTAGKFVPLSFDTYKEMVRGSFSYFTVLRQVNSPE